MISNWRYLCITLSGLLLFSLSGARMLHAIPPDKGMFLVAAEQLADPRFHERVVLLIQHDAQGTAGLVINRSSRLALTKVLPQDSLVAVEGATLSYGGPVEPEALLALVKVRKHPPEPADEVLGGLYVTGLGVLEDWPDFAAEVIACRAFVGYVGWAPGQLDLEVQKGDWQVVPADEESVFADNGKHLWERLHIKQEQN